jgi:integrase
MPVKQNNPLIAQPTSSRLATLSYTQPQLFHLRDGELVLYRRTRSSIWQCRFKLADGHWHRSTTHCYALETAVASATNLYDETRYRLKLGLAHRAHSFAHLAHATLDELRTQLDAGIGKSVYNSYITCIERYFLPYFGERQLEHLTHTDVIEFEAWRNRQMGKRPKASTLNNFSSAWARLCSVAVARGWTSERVAIPKLSTLGLKSNPRPAFNRAEIDQLLAFMVVWSKEGRLAVEREMRPLLRDYVELLLYTGIRHGTEALGLCWNNIEWHTFERKKYLRLWVSGKTGGRWLIAKHKAVEPLQRLHQRQKDIQSISWEDLLSTRHSGGKSKVFAFSTGYQPPSLNGTFRRLMRDSGLEKSEDGQNRTLYSLRHTYATLELLEHGTDLHLLAKQMGNSAAMIERHYSKLTATMSADKLAL